MKLKSSQLKANARGHLTGKYAFPIIAYMITDMVISTVSLVASLIGDPNSMTGQWINIGISLILSAITAIFMVGQNKICLHLARNSQFPAISDIWYGFKGHADNIIVAFFQIFIRCFVYAIPFILASIFYTAISGIYAAIVLVFSMLFFIGMSIRIELDYALVFFLVIDHPKKTASQLLAHSKELMEGNRKKLFCLQLSFIGMYILVLLSFGFASFWVMPYIRMTLTEFYINLTAEPVMQEVIVEDTEDNAI